MPELAGKELVDWAALDVVDLSGLEAAVSESWGGLCLVREEASQAAVW